MDRNNYFKSMHQLKDRCTAFILGRHVARVPSLNARSICVMWKGVKTGIRNTDKVPETKKLSRT